LHITWWPLSASVISILHIAHEHVVIRVNTSFSQLEHAQTKKWCLEEFGLVVKIKMMAWECLVGLCTLCISSVMYLVCLVICVSFKMWVWNSTTYVGSIWLYHSCPDNCYILSACLVLWWRVIILKELVFIKIELKVNIFIYIVDGNNVSVAFFVAPNQFECIYIS
jgi:hypothetical protein